jgi:hypothetical protein
VLPIEENIYEMLGQADIDNINNKKDTNKKNLSSELEKIKNTLKF